MSIPVIAVAMVCATFVSCSNDDEVIDIEDGYVSRSIAITADERDASVQSNRFAWSLLEETMRENDDNVVLSPVSANICLSMLANAANGATRSQILDALGYNNMDMADVNSLNSKLTKQLSGLDKYVKLAFANSFWSDPSIHIKKAFTDDLSKNYDIETRAIKPATFTDDVNSWCKDKTNGLIPKFLDSNSPLYSFAFLNALYFKGIWKSSYKFDSKNTKKDKFCNADGTSANIQFMHHKTAYPYIHTPQWEAMQIPFSGGAFSFTVIQPNDGYSISDCMQSIKDFEPATGKFGFNNLDLKLPKFKMNQQVELNKDLQRMGIVDVFAEYGADLSNMSDTQMFVDMVKQSVSFEVNEEGAEGAAVTFVGGVVSTSIPSEPEYYPFHVDRPFIFMISESSTGAILFLGRINKF